MSSCVHQPLLKNYCFEKILLSEQANNKRERPFAHRVLVEKPPFGWESAKNLRVGHNIGGLPLGASGPLRFSRLTSSPAPAKNRFPDRSNPSTMSHCTYNHSPTYSPDLHGRHCSRWWFTTYHCLLFSSHV